ncbi:MAG: NAD(P)/FAD-dependent oxidoreductase [Sneathiellaceae bacterium]
MTNRIDPAAARPGPTRRALLRGVGASAAIAAAGALLPRIVAPALAGAAAGRKRVLVLGAGMAGLTAALALLRRGHEVTVIEYQDRVGGRVLSLPLGEGMVSEAGAGHFRANMPYTLSYIRQFRLPVLSLNDGLPRYTVRGHAANAADLADWPWPLSREERQVSVSSNLNRYLYRNGLDTDTVLSARWPGPEQLDRLSDITLRELLQNVGATDAFCDLLDAHGGTFTSGAQALGIIPDLAYHFGDQNLFRIRGGNDRLPQALAGAIGPQRIHLGDPVAAIDQDGALVRVTTRSGAEFAGDAAISTIPFSVMGEVAVTPAWSAGKAALIAGIDWDQSVKVVVKARTPSWLAHGVHGWPMAGGDRRWERIVDITGNAPFSYGNAFFYMNGGNAAAYREGPRQTRAQDLFADFQADMPGLIDEAVSLQEFDWKAQPWIRGSFGSTPLGGAWMVREWAKPEGRLHFAGDFVTLKTGWVEGAIESGLRAARQIDPEAPAEGHPWIRQELPAAAE